MRRRVLPFDPARVDPDPTAATLVAVLLDAPCSPHFFQLRGACSQWLEVLAVGVVDSALLRTHGRNVFDVVYTEVDDLRAGPLDEVNGCWPLWPRGAQKGDHLAAWLRNFDTAQLSARGYFVVGDLT
jgi:hypothetical protein